MKFDLKKPCAQCPFRTDITPFIRPERAEEICASMIDLQQAFPCHKTVDYNNDGDGVETPDSQHCAGAMIMLEHMDRPNQMMRIAERLRFYDRNKLDMTAPVYTSDDEMIDRHYEEAKV